MSSSSRWLIAMVVWSLSALAPAQPVAKWADLMASGTASRHRGAIDQSITHFQDARRVAANTTEHAQALRELGASLLQARRLEAAALSLQEAQALSPPDQLAGLQLDLGNLALLRKDTALAAQHYAQAQDLAGMHSLIGLQAGLNLARLAQPALREQRLEDLSHAITRHPVASRDARLYLNLGHQALSLGPQTNALAQRSLQQAHALTSPTPEARLHLESMDALAQWHENQGQLAEANRLNQAATERLRAAPNSPEVDLAVALAWRAARLHRAQGRDHDALAAYQHAVNQLERIRPDIPIDYDDGQSSFRTTFEPIYLGLVDTLLKTVHTAPTQQVEAALRRARDVAELLKQTEMQDYLGDRCAVDAIKGGSSTVIGPGTAILYPIIFPDRVELLLETQSGMARYTSTVSREQVQATAASLADELRSNRGKYLVPAQQLYDWTLRPLEGFMTTHTIHTVVVIPDATLRTVPMGVLHDGKTYAIEKYAIATATGLSMTNTNPPPRTALSALIAGASSFGQVVDKYGSTRLAELLGDGLAPPLSAAPTAPAPPGRMLRSARARAAMTDTGATTTRSEQLESLRSALALPGVTKEVHALQRILPGTGLLDAGFTVDAFRSAAQSQQHRLIHVASHGVFGGSADSSYILAYDDLLTLDGLQTMLSGEQFRKHPIELLSLSACETAAGNDRAPLGISGAAMKARAKSVLGTLWPVDDEAAVLVMESFYQGLTQQGLSKAQALRQAQRQLIGKRQLAHPFYWAPFALIGNWL